MTTLYLSFLICKIVNKNTTLKEYYEIIWASQVVLVIKNQPANAGDIRDIRFDPSVRKIPWRRAWQPTPVLLPGESQARTAWWATVYRVAKIQT